MKGGMDRREFLKLAGIGGVVFVSGMGGSVFAAGDAEGREGFTFVQLSDTHIGMNDPKLNPDYAGTLKKAVAAVNGLTRKPDFVVFTGDLIHTTEDPVERRRRLKEFMSIAADLEVKDVYFMPGEHDAGLDKGEAYREFFGNTRFAFEHKGVHFIAVDNVSDPTSSIGDEQLTWLAGELGKLDRGAPLVVFTHRPLFPLYPQWDWWTRDGQKALDLLKPYTNAAVFYGHIHQLHQHIEGSIKHYAANSLIFQLPAPGSRPKRDRIPWDPAMPYKGQGWRTVRTTVKHVDDKITEYPVLAAAKSEPAGKVIQITARRFEYSPKEITLKKGVPVVLELTALDRLHGFNCPDLGIRGDINPGKVTSIAVTPQKAGIFTFFCDIVCGDGHEEMNGTFRVDD